MPVDRRRADRERRAALRVPAVFAVKSTIEGQLQLGQAENVGPGGLTMRRPEDLPLAPGTGVVLTFGLPGREDLVATLGLVVTDLLVGSYRRTGIRFLALPADGERQIAAFCQDTLARLYPEASVA